jgi:hypothetical protein
MKTSDHGEQARERHETRENHRTMQVWKKQNSRPAPNHRFKSGSSGTKKPVGKTALDGFSFSTRWSLRRNNRMIQNFPPRFQDRKNKNRVIARKPSGIGVVK